MKQERARSILVLISLVALLVCMALPTAYLAGAVSGGSRALQVAAVVGGLVGAGAVSALGAVFGHWLDKKTGQGRDLDPHEQQLASTVAFGHPWGAIPPARHSMAMLGMTVGFLGGSYLGYWIFS